MTERIRVRRPWLAVLTPSAAALFSTVLVWATGHDPGAAALATAATTAAPSPGTTATQPAVTPTRDPAAVGRQIATARRRTCAGSWAAAGPSLGPPSSGRTRAPSTGSTASATRPPTYPRHSSGVPSPSGGRPAPTTPPAAPTPKTQPTRAPAPVHNVTPPAPPTIPTPHVTTRSS